MGSEDELLCLLAAVIKQREKTAKKRKNTGYGFSGFTKKERNMGYHI